MPVPLWLSVLVSCPYCNKWLEMKARKARDHGRAQEPWSQLHMEANHGGSLRATVLGSSKLLSQQSTEPRVEADLLQQPPFPLLYMTSI